MNEELASTIRMLLHCSVDIALQRGHSGARVAIVRPVADRNLRRNDSNPYRIALNIAEKKIREENGSPGDLTRGCLEGYPKNAVPVFDQCSRLLPTLHLALLFFP